jgi:hypothetical protein
MSTNKELVVTHLNTLNTSSITNHLKSLFIMIHHTVKFMKTLKHLTDSGSRRWRLFQTGPKLECRLLKS